MPASERTARQKQRDATRARILEAAVQAFTEKGFHGASTRDIARLADTNQGLITYHFSSKEAQWRAAADTLFNDLKKSSPSLLPAKRLVKCANAFYRLYKKHSRAWNPLPAMVSKPMV